MRQKLEYNDMTNNIWMGKLMYSGEGILLYRQNVYSVYKLHCFAFMGTMVGFAPQFFMPGFDLLPVSDIF